MGLPFPPPWVTGRPCYQCPGLFDPAKTPKYIYAVCQFITFCPDPPPALLDPNGLVRLTQDDILPCVWHIEIDKNGITLDFELDWENGWSVFWIADSLMRGYFGSVPPVCCVEHFINENVCFVTPFAVAFGGRVDIFW